MLSDLVRRLPKAEVHVHLEGAIPAAELVEAAALAGVPLPGPAKTLFDVSTHAVPAAPSELSAYLRFLDWVGSLVTTTDQLAGIAYRFAARQRLAGVTYTDLIVNPSHWPAWRRDVSGLVRGLAEGFVAAESDGLGSVNLCVSLDRGQSRLQALELAERLTEKPLERVVAISVDGDESRHGRTSHRFAEAFEIAARAGLGRTVHAGESSGADGVWDALVVLKADRIDHGIRAIDDDRLIDHLAENRIPVGMCPTSNVALGLIDSLGVHPLETFRSRGVLVTVNTDDPAPLGTSIDAEWTACAEAFGWGDETLIDLARGSFAASYAPDPIRAVAGRRIDRIASTRDPLGARL